jgi:hypothetical protein
MSERDVDCRRCLHFYLTYQMPRPYACRHFGFESAYVPSAEVLASSGEACRAFEPRPRPAPARADPRPRESAG